MSVGLQIRLARVRQGIKGKDLATEVGIHPGYLSQIENERAPGLSVSLLARLCRALGVRPDALMEWDQMTTQDVDSKSVETSGSK